MLPAILFASDFGGLGRLVMFILGATVVGALMLGFINAGLMVWYTRRKAYWLAGVPLTIIWGAVIWTALRIFAQ
jgi:hypothetical protein